MVATKDNILEKIREFDRETDDVSDADADLILACLEENQWRLDPEQYPQIPMDLFWIGEVMGYQSSWGGYRPVERYFDTSKKAFWVWLSQIQRADEEFTFDDLRMREFVGIMEKVPTDVDTSKFYMECVDEDEL